MSNTNNVSAVTRYKAADGSLFTTAELAEKHNLELNLKDILFNQLANATTPAILSIRNDLPAVNDLTKIVASTFAIYTTEPSNG